MKKLFKSIWNFFFHEKEEEYFQEPDTLAQSGTKPEEIRAKAIKPQTQLFRKHQLLGKIYRLGKSRFRIKKKSGFTHPEKLRYEITQL